MFIEGTPQEVPPSPTECAEEVEKVLERDGGKVRLLLDTDRPRLGDLLRLGVEVRALGRQKTGVAGLSAQPNPSQTLRPLRRVRVEFFRRILINTTTSAPSSSTASPDDEGKQHVTLLYASGKSLRYPGTNSQHPPLRVLFTVPTAQLGAVAEQTWGEITMATRYHTVGFFVRVSLGFDGPAADWEIEREIVVRPKLWQMVVSPGTQSGLEQVGDADENMNMTDEDVARVAYRLKGHDMVGQGGTTRVGGDLPPPFEAEGGEGSSRGGLPTFLESEALMRAGEVPLPSPSASQEGFDRATTVGRRGSLGGELGMWDEVSCLSCPDPVWRS